MLDESYELYVYKDPEYDVWRAAFRSHSLSQTLWIGEGDVLISMVELLKRPRHNPMSFNSRAEAIEAGNRFLYKPPRHRRIHVPAF